MIKMRQEKCKKNELNILKRKVTGTSRKTEEDQISVDLVLQARAKMSENKVNGPEDALVSEMIKQLPLEKICTLTKCFQERFMGQMEAPRSWKNCETGVLPETGGHCADIGDVEVGRVLHYSSSGK